MYKQIMSDSLRTTKPARVSIITPVGPGHEQFLLDAYYSLLDQSVAWEWIVQIDSELLPEACGLPDDPRISVHSNGRNLGQSATSNRALVHAQAPYVFELDADDRLLDGALEKLVR